MVRRLAKKGRANAIAALKRPPVPEEFAHVLLWYREIRAQTLRGYHFEPMQISEMVAYRDGFELHEHMGPFEMNLLLILDGLWRKVQPKPEKSSNDNTTPMPGGQPRPRP